MRPFFFGGLYDHRAAGLSNRRSAKPDPGGRLEVAAMTRQPVDAVNTTRVSAGRFA